MPVQRRKTSKSRRNKRRTHDSLKKPPLTLCSHCQQPTLPHRVCPSCGFYKGREVIKPSGV